MAEATNAIAEQFDSSEQQHESAWLGLWAFLATEVLFFGGVFLGYIVYRHVYYESFVLASRTTNLVYGTVNTAVLLTSSLTMALAVHAAQVGKNKNLVRFLILTILLAITFMGVKGVEYYEHYKDHQIPGPSFVLKGAPEGELFYYFYFTMTGLHALHVVIGIGLLSVMALLAARRRFNPAYYTPVELSGLYWHFVDIVWIFLYPLIYLISRHS
ncbi:MAG: cytochrome c oxidase subunit 3 family protein [Pedosphaera sp.]|nr:cytochrome c oxidase subunit 3 family protein [Pedosphaera sp.]